MKTTAANRPAPVDEGSIQSLDQALQDAFGVQFDLWAPSDTWKPLGDRRPDSHIAEVLKKALKDLGDREGEPRAVPLPDDRLLLVLPIGRRRRIQLVASAAFSDWPGDLLIRIGKLFLVSFAQQEEIEQLQRETSSLVQQVSDNFEELAFLRDMAEFMEVADMSHGLVRMSEFLFPLLNKTIQAEALFFVSADSSCKPSADRADRAVFSAEPAMVDEFIAMRLVNEHYASIRNSPLVKNGCDQAITATETRGLRSFMLTSVRGENCALGWLLAVNRQIGSETEVQEALSLAGASEFGSVEASLLSTSASILGAYGRNYSLLREKEQLLVNMVRVMVSAIEAKDPYTCGHSERVALFAERLAAELGLGSADCARLYLTGLLHDIGKIGVPDALLLKETRLTQQEYEQIKLHPDQGWRILYDLEQLRHVIPGILYHHEHFDGTGYPDGLLGEEIPLDGRILAVADTYDAMTSDRPY